MRVMKRGLTSLRRLIREAQAKGEKSRAQELYTEYRRKGGKLSFGQAVNYKVKSYWKKGTFK